MRERGTRPWWFWKAHWSKRNTWGGHRITIILITMLIMINAIPYTLINHFASWRDYAAFDPELSIDTNLAFIPWMIIPYMTLYLYYPAAALLGNKNDMMMRQNIIFHQMLTVSCWLVFCIFMLAPVKIDLRGSIDDTMNAESLWHSFYVFMHSIDTPWNAWPSLHIVQSTQVVLVMRYWYPSETRRIQIMQGCLLFAWFMLVLSTMFTKQHYLWDVITGLLYAIVTWRYWMKPAMERLKTKEYIDAFEKAVRA